MHKSSGQFSPIIIDQALEQANAVFKADGGAFGVTGYPAALKRWMVTGPEVTCLITQWETACITKESTEHSMQQVAKMLK